MEGEMRGFFRVIALMAAVAGPLCASGLSADTPRVRVLILTGESDFPSHDWRVTTPVLRGLLERTGRFDVRAAEEVRGITAAALSGYDVLVLHYNGPRWPAETEKAVEDFVRDGKGMVALHAINYGSFLGMEQKRTRWVSAGPGWVA
jgi:hypothetical protein